MSAAIKRFLTAWFILGAAISLSAVPVVWTPGDPPIRISAWEVKESERDAGLIVGPVSDEGFQAYNGGYLIHDLNIKMRRYTFRTDLDLSWSAKGQALALYIGPGDYPRDIYINGVQILKTGDYGERYNATIYYTARALLPPDVLSYGGTVNRLRVEAFPAYETSPLSDIYIGSYLDISRMAFYRNLFNVNLVQAAVVVALIIAIFFGFMFFRSPDRDRRYLYCMLFSLSFALGYSNMSLYNDAADDVLLDKLSRTGLVATSLSLCCFGMVFTGILMKVRWLKPTLSAISLISVIGNVLQRDKQAVASFFSAFTSNFVLMPMLLLTGYILIAGFVKKRESARGAVLIGFILAVSASVHDIYYVTVHITPYCYLVSYGYLALLVSIFFVSALEQGRISQELRSRTRRLDERNQILGDLMVELTGVSEGLVGSSSSMSTTIAQTLSAVTAFGDENKRICDSLSVQLGQIEAELAAIRETMTISSERIPEALENQMALVEAVNRTLSRMKSTIEENLKSAENSSVIAGALATEAGIGARVLDSSKSAIKQLVEHTKSLQGILGAIDDIVSRTHVLSINAAIESARLGSQGKGFAVVAQEIRSLSDQSQRSLGSSFGTIEEMSSAVDKGAELSDRAAASLLAITDKAKQSADRAESMRGQMVSQRTEGEEMMRNAEDLARQAALLKKLSADERAANETRQADFQALHASLGGLAKQLIEQDKRKTSLYFALDMLKDVAAANDRHITNLRGSLEKAKEADVHDLVLDVEEL